MTLPAICALPVEAIAAPDSILFLWATFPHLESAFQVIEAWGFTYKTVAFVWVKPNKKSPGWFWGTGFWTRANAEICLLAIRGKPRAIAHNVHQIIDSPAGIHSEKPPETRARIVALMGDLPRVELFARQRSEGWAAWGNQVECSIILPTEKEVII